MLGLTIIASTHLSIPQSFGLNELPYSYNAQVALDETSHSDSQASATEPELDQSDTDTIVPDWTAEYTSPLIISAINPGYTVNGVGDVGELIELRNLSDDSVDLTGYTISYTNTQNKTNTIVEFPPGSRLEGQVLLLRLARRADPGADYTYTTSLATSAGPLTLSYRDQVIDSVCWTGKNGCYPAFNSSVEKRTTLVRNLSNGTFEHLLTYDLEFDPEHPALVLPSEPEDDEQQSDATSTPGQPQCYKLEFSEILSYYDTAQTEQFIELYNPSDVSVQLDGCNLRYKNKTYALAGTILAGDYYAFYPADVGLSLTKNPTSSNTIELIDVDGQVVDYLEYYHGQKKLTSYARFYDEAGETTWILTYQPTPGASNNYQEFRTCEAGKVINPETGNCVKVADTTATACPEGKYRNPLTGRCKAIETASTTKECAEGYERNPETNRCRKITTANEGASYALVSATYSDRTTFIGLGIVSILVLIGGTYVVLQFRREIARTARKTFQRIHHFREDLCAGKIIHRNRHK